MTDRAAGRPYFSATLLKCRFNNGAREDAASVMTSCSPRQPSGLELTGGAAHVTGASDAARTTLCDMRTDASDNTMCDNLSIPMSLPPGRRNGAAAIGV